MVSMWAVQRSGTLLLMRPLTQRKKPLAICGCLVTASMSHICDAVRPFPWKRSDEL